MAKTRKGIARPAQGNQTNKPYPVTKPAGGDNVKILPSRNTNNQPRKTT